MKIKYLKNAVISSDCLLYDSEEDLFHINVAVGYKNSFPPETLRHLRRETH